MALRYGPRPRQIDVFDDRINVWRGFGPGNTHREYALTRERAHRIGRLLDGCAEIHKLSAGTLVYTWMEGSK